METTPASVLGDAKRPAGCHGDTQVYSVNAELVNYGGNPDQTTVVAAPMSALAEDVPLDYLAFTPDHCVFFEVGDFASLGSLATSEGMLEPGFQSDVFEYFMLLSAESLPDMILRLTPLATHDGARITLNGVPVQSGFPVPVLLRIGENKVMVEVVSNNGLTVRTYIVTVYVLLEELVGTQLSMIKPSVGTLTPGFDSDETKYSIVVDQLQEDISFQVASVLNDPVAVCVVAAPEETLRELWVGPQRPVVEDQWECTIVESGHWSDYLALNPGELSWATLRARWVTLRARWVTR